jgi:hypothetical protein
MSGGKQRHGCLTAWLVLMIIANSGTALVYLLGSAAIKQNLPNAPGWAFPVLAVLGILNVACAVALLQWKKWGFFGFIASALAAFGVNLAIGLNIVQACFGLVGVAVLYAVLQIGNENKGWPQLE